jgi:hypothetical protein
VLSRHHALLGNSFFFLQYQNLNSGPTGSAWVMPPVPGEFFISPSQMQACLVWSGKHSPHPTPWVSILAWMFPVLAFLSLS